MMATILSERRAPIRGGRKVIVGLATLALAVAAALGIWQMQRGTEVPSVERAMDLSAEAVRIRNSAKVHDPAAYGFDQAPGVGRAVDLSAEAVRIRNSAKVHDPAAYGFDQAPGVGPAEDLDAEAVRIRNLAKRYDS
jgi:hypothetical protein